VNGDKPIGLAIGMVVVAFLVALPALIVSFFYVFANVHAIVVGFDFSSDEMIVGVFAALLVVTVALCLLLMFAVVNLIGKALAPRHSEQRA
jgi:Ca2+/Na+ antiporter